METESLTAQEVQNKVFRNIKKFPSKADVIQGLSNFKECKMKPPQGGEHETTSVENLITNLNIRDPETHTTVRFGNEELHLFEYQIGLLFNRIHRLLEASIFSNKQRAEIIVTKEPRKIPYIYYLILQQCHNVEIDPFDPKQLQIAVLNPVLFIDGGKFSKTKEGHFKCVNCSRLGCGKHCSILIKMLCFNGKMIGFKAGQHAPQRYRIRAAKRLKETEKKETKTCWFKKTFVKIRGMSNWYRIASIFTAFLFFKNSS